MTMRALPVLILASLSGCAMAGSGEIGRSASEGRCRNEPLDQFAGQRADAALGARMLEVSDAKVLRWVPPDTAVTMDFRPDRLTVWYDESYIITKASCG